MKNYLLLFAVVLGLLCPQLVLGSPRIINIKGKWGDDILRSISPKAPEVSLEGNTLSIHSIDALFDLTIQIVDVNGVIIFDECVSLSPGESKGMTLDDISGTYEVVLYHCYGSLSGEFTIE